MNPTSSLRRSPTRTALAAVLGLTAALIGLVFLAGCERAEPTDDVAVVTDEVDVIPVGPDSALVIETESIDFYEAHERDMEGARTHASALPDSAAAHLEHAAQSLNRRASVAEGEIKTALENAAIEGDRLARNLREGATLAEGEIDDFKAHADIALASYHLHRADRHLGEGHADLAAQQLDIAARAYEAAALHSTGVTEGDASVASRMRETATTLRQPDTDHAEARAMLSEYQRDLNVLRDEVTALAEQDQAMPADPAAR